MHGCQIHSGAPLTPTPRPPRLGLGTHSGPGEPRTIYGADRRGSSPGARVARLGGLPVTQKKMEILYQMNSSNNQPTLVSLSEHTVRKQCLNGEIKVNWVARLGGESGPIWQPCLGLACGAEEQQPVIQDLSAGQGAFHGRAEGAWSFLLR